MSHAAGRDMSGILFLISAFVFALVAYWAYFNDGSGPEAGARGLFGMTGVGEDFPAKQRALGWKRSGAQTRGAGSAPKAEQRPRRGPAPKRRPFSD
jgi:hypothetical protein